MSVPPVVGDPWIDAYLVLRGAVLAGEFATAVEAEEFGRELQRALPSTAPSIPAAMFITTDINIAFPESSSPVPSVPTGEIRELMRGLWTPNFAR